MKLVVFGLTISSSWGNGHATLWRGLAQALGQRRVRMVFFERDVAYYAGARDSVEIPGCELVLYSDWESIRAHALAELSDADAAIVTSFCPDGVAATDLVLDAPRAVRCFYDLDTPVTMAKLEAGEPLSYIGARGLADFDLVLSYTGGRALDALRARLGARQVAALYGHADPALHRPTAPRPEYAADLSYLGTYSADRQAQLEHLLIDPAQKAPTRRFLIGGAQYPQAFPWSDNIYFVRHLPPAEHPAFFSSCRATLNVTRPAMATMGWCPSGRLFEAAACAATVISDDWEGLEAFFVAGEEIIIARSGADILAALDRDDGELRRIGAKARERVFAWHTSAHRADELLGLLESCRGAVAAEQGLVA